MIILKKAKDVTRAASRSKTSIPHEAGCRTWGREGCLASPLISQGSGDREVPEKAEKES